jgi:peptidoglycan/LPS O-acetylase OafA/YrhL
VRGLAALAVFIYHFLQAFLPPAQAPGFADNAGIVVERPFLLALVNGPFMVAVFFVLSSFAVTAKLVTHPNPHATLIAICKRFPRLLPLTIAGSMLAGTLLASGLMFNQEAAQIMNSGWLERSGGVKPPPDWPVPSIAGSMIDAIATFWRGLSQYNSALWTMKYELFGSIFALITSLAISGRIRPVADVVITLLIGLVVLPVHPLCSLCVASVLVTKYLLLTDFRLSKAYNILLIFAGLALGSTYKPFPSYLLEDEWMRTQVLRADWLIHGLGALLFFLGVRCLAEQARRPWTMGQRLGKLSFSIYVLHVPIIGSVGAGIILALGYNWMSIAAAFVASLTILLLLAVPLSRFDAWWVAWLNRLSRRFGSFGARRDRLEAQGQSTAP